MAFTFYIILAAFFVQTISAFDFPMEREEMRAIQERLVRLEGIEKTYKSLIAPEEDREEKCLPVGSGCTFGSGLNCCGLRTRCFIWDHYTAQRKGPAKWHSVCREYNGGIAVDEIIKFFKRLG